MHVLYARVLRVGLKDPGPILVEPGNCVREFASQIELDYRPGLEGRDITDDLLICLRACATRREAGSVLLARGRADLTVRSGGSISSVFGRLERQARVVFTEVRGERGGVGASLS